MDICQKMSPPYVARHILYPQSLSSKSSRPSGEFQAGE